MKPIKLLLILFFIWCSGALVTGALLSAQPTLDVSGGDIETPSLALDPFLTASAPTPSATAGEAKIYYDTDSNDVYLSENSAWGPVAIPKNVATIIVAASDSLDRNKADPAYRCNGAGDGIGDQTEINAAITATAAVGGGAVYLLEGTYEITGSINMASNISLIGAGSGTVLKIPDSTNATFNVINGSSANLLISKLKIDGNKDNVSGTISGISFSGVTYSKVDKVWIENMRTTGIYLNSSSNNNILSGNNLQGNSLYGIYVYNSSNNTLSGNNAQGNGDFGILLWTSSNNTLSGNNVQGNDYNGICLRASSNNNTLSGNNLQGNSLYGIYVYNSSNNILSGNNVQGNSLYGIYVYNSSNNTLSDNNVQGNGYNGIYLRYSSNNNNIIGNIIVDNGDSYDGIKIEGSAAYPSNNNIISSNQIYNAADATSSGINISDSYCNNNYLVANYITGSFPTKINDAGSNTKYTGKDKLTLEPSSTYYLESGTNTLRFGWLDTVPNPDEQRPAPISHLVFNETAKRVLGKSGADAIEDGKSAGDLLILGNSATFTVTVPDDQNTKLTGAHVLGQYDTLELIWNGNVWVEVSWTNVP